MQDAKLLLNKSLNEIKRLKAVNQQLEQARREPIAIVGAACRYPGGIDSLDQFWKALEEGRDCITRMDDQRWPMRRFLAKDGGIYSDAMGLLENIDRFDPTHFNLTHDEAKHIDPQHRLLMELLWGTIEDAGYAVDSFAGSRTGVYVGLMSDDYGQLQGPLEAANYYIGAGTSRSCAAGRLAYTYGLEGPAMTLDTACSSSLVSVHLAVQALRRGECDAALAGGANLILSPQGSVVACRSQMLSRSGHCHTFDASADGYVRSEGCGLVLLKRLSDALKDGDQIYALIRGSAVNHDGRTQGLTAPSGQAQRRVIAAALADAGVAPEAVDFVECHGTGTALGDPIEVRAIDAAYITGANTNGAKGENTEENNTRAHKPLIIGALKSNLGHMEAAAGIGGLHKAMQVVRHRKVPKNIHFNTLNPQIKVDLTTLRIAVEPVMLAAEGSVYAAVSSFGFSGTNAHVILESYTAEPDTASKDQQGIFRLAARSSTSLNNYIQRYLTLLDSEAPIDLPALCRTAATGRSDGDFRIAFSVRQPEDLRACLEEYISVAGGDEIFPVAKSFPCLWVIGGQTNVDWALARRLYDSRSVYRTLIADAYAYLQTAGYPHKLEDFQRLLDGAEQTVEVLPHAIHRWALAKLLIHFGLSPRRIIGFGAGEYIAASIAGLVNWKDLMDILASGKVSPDIAPGRKLYEFVSAAGKNVMLPQAWIAHPPMDFEGERNALTTDFSADSGTDEFCEIVLTNGVSLQMTDAPEENVFLWVYGQTNRDPGLPLEGFLAQCYMAGYALRWERVFEDQPSRRISLPSYPFQRQRVWTDWGYSFDESLPSTVGRPGIETQQRTVAATRAGESIAHSVLQSVFACPSGMRNFSGEVSLITMPYLSAHVVLGEILLPASLFIDVILAAGRWCWPDQPLLVDDLQLLRKRVLGDDPIEIYCHVNPAEGAVAVYSKTHALDDWQQNVRARLTTCKHTSTLQPEMTLPPYQAKCSEALSIRHFYQGIALNGLSYGESFQGIFELYRGSRCALAKIALPPLVEQSLNGFLTHPILLDSCLQAIAAASRPNASQGIYVPSKIKGVRFYKPLPEILWCLVDVSAVNNATPSSAPEAQQGTSYASLMLLDSQGECVMSIDRFETTLYKEVGEIPARSSDPYVEWLYEKHWLPDETDIGGTSAPQNNGQHADRKLSHWLLFSDQGAMCNALETELIARGDRVSVVCLDDPVQPHRNKVSLHELADLNQMLSAVEEGTQPVNGAIYGWSLAGFDPISGEQYTDRLAQYAKYPLWLCQAVLAPGRRHMALSFLTRGSQPVGQAALSQPLASLLWGHVTSFVNENGMYASLIDLDPTLDLTLNNGYGDVAMLLRTLENRNECQFALREGRRFVARLRASNLDAAREVRIDASGSYLITGGFGALGLETVKALVGQGARHLILVGRTAGTGESLIAIQALEAMGAHIYPLAADIANEDDFASTLSERLKGLPPLKGVIHSAGVLADGIVAQQHWDNYLKVFAPKVDGTLALYRAVREHPLDFFVLYSSAASILGNPGQANYAAANAFLDSFAWYLKGVGLHGTSINWGGWSQIGVAANLEQELAGGKASLLGFIPPQQGIRILEHQFASSRTQFAVLPLNQAMASGGDNMPYLRKLLCEVLGNPSATKPRAMLAASGLPAGQTPVISVLATLGRVTGEERRTRLKQYLSKVIAETLKRDQPLDDRVSLFDLGLDSLLGIDLRLRIEKDLGCVLASTLFHDYPVILDLTDYLLNSVIGDGEAAAEDCASTLVESPLVNEGKDRLVSSENVVIAPMAVGGRVIHQRQNEDIAIIGLSGRYPGAPDLQTLWENLREGRDAITEVPADRWNHDAYFDSRKHIPGKSYSAYGGFIDGVDQFDPEFFNIPKHMAAYMDPKERLFLETVWNLFEEAAYTREKLKQDYGSNVGVFVGAMYQLYSAFAGDIHEQAATALSSYNAIAHRVSYFFNLRGPSVAVDTMCSSSLTAVHLACQSIYNGDCEMAIAGGINLSIHPIKYVGLSQAQIVGSHSGSRSFSDGDGFLPAEGVGAVLLKPLRRAIEDGDRIEAVIKASTINHGGRSTGFFAPNIEAQVKLIEDNFHKANIEPASIQYVEAAANGTSLGDAVEFKALSRVFTNAGVKGDSCPIGTVKSNIGHAEAASGMAQIAKVILQMRHRTLVPTIKVEPLNPNIHFSGSPFYLLDHSQPWPQPEQGARRATVSSFGAGGANAHLILEEFVLAHSGISNISNINEVTPTATPCVELIVLSARSQPQLQNVVNRLLEYLDRDITRTAALDVQQAWLANIAHTLQSGREEMDCRLSLLVNDIDQLRQGLFQYLNMGASTGDKQAVPMQVGNVQDQLELRNLLLGKAGELMAQALAAERQLEKLALHWVQGGRVSWKTLRQGQPVQHLSLPTYPFSRARYWLSGGKLASASQQPPKMEPGEGDAGDESRKEVSGVDD